MRVYRPDWPGELTAARFIWRALWRQARRKAREPQPSPRFGTPAPEGAALCLAWRTNPCDPLGAQVDRAGLACLWRAYRAWRDAGCSPATWREFKGDARARCVAMQALAQAVRRLAVAPWLRLVPTAAAVLRDWGIR